MKRALRQQFQAEAERRFYHAITREAFMSGASFGYRIAQAQCDARRKAKVPQVPPDEPGCAYLGCNLTISPRRKAAKKKGGA